MGKIIENYSILEQLGQGVYGKVYKAVHMKTKQQVAIKVIHADKFKQIPKLEECTVNQINILSTMQQCPYIVKYIDMLKTVNNFYFVYEFCNGGTLDKLMQKQGPFPEKRALIYFRQMVEAFKVLSKNNIMHRDLKPDNILMHNGTIKLGDFGFCKPLQNSTQMANTMLGSPIYMAPEVLKGETYNMKADIWSLGVVLFQMIFGKCPFESKSIAKLIKLLDEEDLVIPETPKISPTMDKLLRKMLVKDFNSRIEWAQIFEHTITQGGQIFAPKTQVPLNQFQLRASIKSTSNFGMNGNQMYPSSISNTSIGSNQTYSSTQNGGLTPKINKSFEPIYDQTKNLMLKKKSPGKNQNQISITSQYKGASYYKTQGYNKNDRPLGRFEMLVRNHGKLLSINQIVVDCLKFQKEGSSNLMISFILYKNIEKQMQLISQGLKKQPSDSRTQDFRLTIDKQIQNLRQIIINYRDCFQQQDSLLYLGSVQQPNKIRVMKYFYESLRTQNQQQIILAAQIIDYLDEGLMIKKDSYEKMGKQTLLKQVRNKFSKYL